MTPDQATFLLNTYLGTMKHESRITKSVLLAVPGDRLDYRPDPHAKTAIELARHIANADNRFVETVVAGAFDPSPAIPDAVRAPADLAAWYEARYAGNLAALESASPEQLVKVVDFRGLLQRQAINFLMLGLHHTIHHRGQLSSYLRSMGGRVPAIYGESHDTAEAKRAASATVAHA
jgi:uncharacterized damage-inducible protein DinB